MGQNVILQKAISLKYKKMFPLPNYENCEICRIMNEAKDQGRWVTEKEIIAAYNRQQPEPINSIE